MRSRTGAVVAKVLLDKHHKRVHPFSAPKPRQSQEQSFSLTQTLQNENARELLSIVRARIATRQGYMKLMCLGSFFIIYILALLQQQRTTDAFSVESSFIMSDIMGSLPTNGQGGIFNAGGPGSKGLLTSSSQLISWLGTTILPSLFQDAVCGDGSCDADEEPAVGRFGCMKDCGRAGTDKTIQVEILMQTTIQQDFIGAFSTKEYDPTFKYNIFSKARNDFLFEHPLSPSNMSVKFETLSQDELELRLYQTKSLANLVDPIQLQNTLRVVPATVPPRSAKTDFTYGDVFEFLAVVATTLDAVQSYCLNCNSHGCNTRVNDTDVCVNAFLQPPQTFEPTSYFINFFDAYGLSGKVTYTAMDPSTGKQRSLSLLESGRESVPFCGALPRPPGHDHYFTSILDNYPSWLMSIIRAAAPCGARREIQAAAQGRRQPNRFGRRRRLAPKGASPPKSAAKRREPNELSATAGGGGAAVRALPNPLGLSLAALGVDSGTDEGGDLWPNVMTNFDPAVWPLFRYTGAVHLAVDAAASPGPAPLRHAVDGAEASCAAGGDDGAPRYCRLSADSDDVRVMAARPLRLGGGARFVLYAVSGDTERTQGWAAAEPAADGLAVCSGLLRVWGCSGGAVSGDSWFNLSAALEARPPAGLALSHDLPPGGGPLAPGPTLRLNLLLTRALGGDELAALRQRLCGVVWGGEDERCEWRMWADLEEGAFGEVWQDDPPSLGRWIAAEAPADASHTVRVTALMESNAEASRARTAVTDEVNTAGFRAAFALAAPGRVASLGDVGTRGYTHFAHVEAPAPAAKRGPMSRFGCATHYECQAGTFCSAFALETWSTDFQAEMFGCDRCETCFSGSLYTRDGACPLDRCGPRAGSFPACWSARDFFDNFTCPDRHALNLSQVPGNLAGPASAPDSESAGKTRRARFLTPFNRLVGALMVRQRRLQKPAFALSPAANGTGGGGGGVCRLRGDSMAAFSLGADPSRGLICLGDATDPSWFGTDPVFASVSVLYDGKLDPFDYYNASELQSPDTATPFGFFPHRYDPDNGGDKPAGLMVEDEADKFLLFFDERATSVQAQRLLSYLSDGQFIDGQTERIEVEMNTFNARLHSFSQLVFSFQWQAGGKIEWDYAISTVPIYLYDGVAGTERLVLETICIVFLTLNSLSEIYDIMVSMRNFTIIDYLSSEANLLDWSHFILMSIGWYYWFAQVRMTDSFEMAANYYVLSSPADETRARLFRTNATEEHRFLQFSRDLSDLATNLRRYDTITSICMILFVMRVLKALDFQPRMALVTRTIATAMSDLVHYVALFAIIFLGYLVAGFLMFGHQIEAFSTTSKAAQFLVIMLLSFDPTQFHIQMEHASPSLAMYPIFIWTWIFLAFFVLLNILLAILIEGYTEVKRNASMSHGMPEELASVLSHELLRFSNWLHWGGEAFVSDDLLAAELANHLNQCPTTLNRAVADYAAIALGNVIQVRLPSGGHMDAPELRSIIQRLPLSKRLTKAAAPAASGPMKKFPVTDGVEVGQMNQKGSRKGGSFELETAYMDRALMGLMGRYGSLRDDWGKLQAGHERPGCREDAPKVRDAGLAVKLKVERARAMPMMDLGRGADVFCAAFVDDGETLAVATGQSAGGRLFQTEIKRGCCEADWTWNEEFEWLLPAAEDDDGEGDSRRVVVMLYDKDQFTADDVIGCVMVELDRLRQEGPLDAWEPVARPPVPPHLHGGGGRGGYLLRKLVQGGEQPEPELKLRVSLHELVAPSQESGPPMPAAAPARDEVEEVEPVSADMRHLKKAATLPSQDED